ncbi:MAG: amino acid permease, partial [Lachnospiraceae bacterium]
VHMPYLAQKSQMVVVAGGWGIFQDERMSSMNTTLLQIITLVLFIGAILLATRGISILKKIATIAGMAMFVMSILFIVMMWAAPQITGASVNDIKWSVDTFMPAIDWKFFTSLSILVLAVGGCEKISPYVNKAKNPAKDFPKAMIALAVMVAVVAILGTIALGMMFTFQSSSADELLTNGQYIAFRKLGEYYHVGNALLILYAIANIVRKYSRLIHRQENYGFI